MKEVTGIITESKYHKSWEGKNGGTNYTHYIKVDSFEDGKEQIQINAKTKEPDFLAVGKEIKLTQVVKTDYGYKGKRTTDFKPKSFGGSSKKQTYKETQRLCKMSALKAAAEVNSKHGRIVIDEKGCNVIARFVLGDIRGDIDNKWDSPEGKDMMCRQSALHSAAQETEAHNISSAERLVEVAEVKYKYIIA